MLNKSIVAIVTPMSPTGDIDFENLKKLVLWHLKSGTSAIVVNGTTGESPTLSLNEKIKIINFVTSIVNGQIPVIAGCGGNSTSDTIAEVQMVKKTSIDYCMVVCPYYNKPTQEGLYEHFKNIAQSVNTKIILYNVPSRTACDLSNETIIKLSKVENIIGIKEASGDLERVKLLREMCGNDFILLSGDDETALDFVKLGGDGVISVTANIYPSLMNKIHTAAKDKNFELAESLNKKLENIHIELFIQSNPIPIKWAMYHKGLIQNGIRLPLTELDINYRKKLEKILELNDEKNL